MSDLPATWEWANLGEIAEISGGIQKQAKRRPVKNKYPFLRVANVLRGRLDLTDVHEVELFEGEIDRYRLRPGDLLVVEGNGSPNQIGRATAWDGSIENCVHQNHLIRVRSFGAVLPKFLEFAWNSPVISQRLREVAGSTSGLYTLSTSKLSSIPIPVPPRAEQARIVEALDDHLSRIEAAQKNIRNVRIRVTHLWSAVLQAVADGSLLEETHRISSVSLGDVAEVQGGIQKQPKRRPVSNKFPFLRVANVLRGRLELSDIHEVELFDGELDRYRVEKGDLLVVEGNGSPDQIGRAAMWHGEIPNAVHQNHLIRVGP